MLNFATIATRTNFLHHAAKEAAAAASKTKSFSVAVDVDNPSATDLASDQAHESAAKFSEVTVDEVRTYINYADMTSSQTFRTSSPLAAPADTTRYIYTIEVQVDGQVQPIFRWNGGFFGNIPGLTSPVNVTAIGREFVEFPQGLNQ